MRTPIMHLSRMTGKVVKLIAMVRPELRSRSCLKTVPLLLSTSSAGSYRGGDPSEYDDSDRSIDNDARPSPLEQQLRDRLIPVYPRKQDHERS